MTQCHPIIKPLIDDLHASGRLRVWSLVMTILGDVVEPRGGVISMSDLLELTDHMNIETGAIRTALSRLAKEQWVVAKRTGRNSEYRFGTQGRDAFDPAAKRIYAYPEIDQSNNWTLALLPSLRAKQRQELSTKLHRLGALHTTNSFALWTTENTPDLNALTDLDCMVMQGNLRHAPDWLKSELAPPQVEQAVQKFIAKFAPLQSLPNNLPPKDAAIARILLIHDWRRMVLRFAPVPQALQPENWSMPRAHGLTAQCYKSLITDSELHWPTPASAQTLAILAARFNPDT